MALELGVSIKTLWGWKQTAGNRLPHFPKLDLTALKFRFDLFEARLLGRMSPAATIEKWEEDISRPSKLYRTRVVEFLGFDPDSKNSTGGSLENGPAVLPIRGGS